MSDFESSPTKEIEIDADGEGGEALLKKTPSPEPEAELTKANGNKLHKDKGNGDRANGGKAKDDRMNDGKNHRKSSSKSRSCSRSGSHSRSRHRHHRSRRRYSRSRSRSPRYRHKHSRHSRSRSRGRRDYSCDRYEDHHSFDTYYHSSSPMSSRKRHQGDRENPAPNRCIGVFGLSLYTQERGLREVFGRYGQISEVQIVYDRQTGRSRGFAFVYFKSTDDAYEAKDRCNGIEIDGRRIRVDFSITERAHTPTPGIYLGRPTGSSSSRRSPGHRYSSTYRRSPSPYSSYGYHRSHSCSPPR